MSSRLPLLAIVIAVAVLAPGCRATPDASAAEERRMTDDSLAVTLAAPARVAVGAAVPFQLTIANRTDRPVTLYLLGREITWDVEVKTADGRMVWQRLDDSPFQEILAVRPLGPREKVVLGSEWPGARPAGQYSATARIFTDGEPLRSAPVSIEVR